MYTDFNSGHFDKTHRCESSVAEGISIRRYPETHWRHGWNAVYWAIDLDGWDVYHAYYVGKIKYCPYCGAELEALK